MSRSFAQSPSLKFAAAADAEPVWPVCFCFLSQLLGFSLSFSLAYPLRIFICQSQLHARTPLFTSTTSKMSSTPLAGLANNNASSVQQREGEMGNLLSLENPVFCCYLFWATVLVVKMLLMSLLTALQRFRYKVSNDKYSPHHHICVLAQLMLPTAARSTAIGCAAQGKQHSQTKPTTSPYSTRICGL